MPPANVGVKLVFLAIFLQHNSHVEGVAEIHHCVILLLVIIMLPVPGMIAPALSERDTPFPSNREPRLWFWVLAVLVAIYSTLEPAAKWLAHPITGREKARNSQSLAIIRISKLVKYGVHLTTLIRQCGECSSAY